MDLGMSGNVALITGAGQNMGRAMALSLANEGVKIAVNDLFPDRADEVVAEIKKAGGEAIAVPGSVTDLAVVQGWVGTILKTWGSLHILVNNAGIPPPSEEAAASAEVSRPSFADMDPKEWDKWIYTNYYGCLNSCYAVIPQMREQRYGRILSIMSDAGRIGEKKQSVYAGAKAALLGFSRSVAREEAKYGITMNCVSLAAVLHKGLVDRWTGTEEQKQARIQAIQRVYPLAQAHNRLGEATDAAFMITVLASKPAEWITGQVISVNGGYSMVG